jgi:hypothetical protein
MTRSSNWKFSQLVRAPAVKSALATPFLTAPEQLINIQMSSTAEHLAPVVTHFWLDLLYVQLKR